MIFGEFRLRLVRTPREFRQAQVHAKFEAAFGADRAQSLYESITATDPAKQEAVRRGEPFRGACADRGAARLALYAQSHA